MSRKFVSPKDPLRYERERVSDVEYRVAQSVTASRTPRQSASQDEAEEAHDDLCVVLQELEDAAREVSFGSGTFDRDLYEALCRVGPAGAVDGKVEVADGSLAIAEHLRSWGYFVISPATSSEDGEPRTLN
ncbi:MAG: hypothetical protein F4210_06145 [Holophagales bacterium]|nr:hypothetical protein [Holophagales bacterium]MYF95077.1 hypothetical protein [Holophagales bacterium]